MVKKKNICLPCSDSKASEEGVIEVKAAWRKLKKKIDSFDRYYTKDVIVYEKNEKGEMVYVNEKYALVGLHIIRKTKNYPTFILTTFNHVDNIENGIYYNNEPALEGIKPPYYQYYDKNGNPDTSSYPNNTIIKRGNIAVKSQEEIHAIPSQLKEFNTAVHQKIKSSNTKSV